VNIQKDFYFSQLRMVGYARVSTDEEKQLYSLANQLDFFKEFAKLHNYKMVRLYTDEGISGKQLKKRDEFIRMLEDAKLGIFDVVVVKDVSRFARNTVDLLTSVRKLRAMGINVLFVNNNLQSLGESEFVITLLGAMAQEESANLSKRIQFGKDINAKRGRVPQEILGYDRVDNYTLRINEEEADLVRRIYSMYLSGFYGMASIAATLRGENILTKKGCEYTEGYIRRILTSPIYCGVLVNHKTQTADFLSGLRKKIPEAEQYHHERPELTIISQHDFEQVQRIREDRLQMQLGMGCDPRRRYSSRHLFSGLVRCADCGCTMIRQDVTRKGSGKVNSYWRCKNGSRTKNTIRCKNKSYVPDHVLQKALSEELQRCASDREAFANELRQAQLEMQPTRSFRELLAEKQKELEDVGRQKQKLMDLYTNDILSIDELKHRLEKLTIRAEELSRVIVDLKRQSMREQNAIKGVETCISGLFELMKMESFSNPKLRSVLSCVEVDADKSYKFVYKVF